MRMTSCFESCVQLITTGAIFHNTPAVSRSLRKMQTLQLTNATHKCEWLHSGCCCTLQALLISEWVKSGAWLSPAVSELLDIQCLQDEVLSHDALGHCHVVIVPYHDSVLLTEQYRSLRGHKCIAARNKTPKRGAQYAQKV